MEKKNKKNSLIKIFPFLIFITTLFMGIAYATINTTEIDVGGVAAAKRDEGVYITNVDYYNDVNADLENSKIISTHKTNMNSEIVLLKKEDDASITYEITVSNTTDYDYYFVYVDYMLGEGTYDNEGISFILDGLNENDILRSNSSLTFKITFHYTNNDASDNNKLISILNFVFQRSGTLVNSGKTSYKIFDKSISKSKIEEVYTVNNIQIPTNAKDSWDASLGKEGTIFAWTLDEDNNGKYELYLGAEGTIILPEDSSNMFNGCDDIKYMDLKYFNAENVTSMKSMFEDVGKSSKEVVITGFEHWNTSNLVNMESMFENTANNADSFEMDISTLNTTNVTNMRNMFRNSGENSTNWSIGDLSKKEINSQYINRTYIAWNVENLEDATNMFLKAAIDVENVELSFNNWSTYSNLSMESMFEEFANNSKTINITANNLNINSQTTMKNMFLNMGTSSDEVTFLGLDSWNVSHVINMDSMFKNCGEEADEFSIGNLSQWNTSKVTNMSDMFYRAGRSADWKLDCSKWNVSNVNDHSNFNKDVSSKVIAPNW